jgi:hypothetical protein
MFWPPGEDLITASDPAAGTSGGGGQHLMI